MKRSKTTRTVELTVERSEILAVRKASGPALAWCNECERRVAFVTPDEAAHAAGTSVRAIFRSVEAGKVHFSEGESGHLLICLDSAAPGLRTTTGPQAPPPA